MHLNFQNGKTLSVGAEMCKKSTSLFKVRDSRTADITSVPFKISLVRGSLSKVWILWCPCDHFCYISRWSSLVGGKILESFYRFNCRLIEIIRVNLISFVTRIYELGNRVYNFCHFFRGNE